MAKYSEIFKEKEAEIKAEYSAKKNEASAETKRALALEKETEEELMLYNEHDFFSTRWVAAKCRAHRDHKSRKWDKNGYRELGTTQFADGSRNRQHTCHSIPRRAAKLNRIAQDDFILDVAEDVFNDHPRWNGEFINNKMEGDKVNTFSTIKMKEVDFDI